MAIPSAPAGSYIQGNQIYLPNGQPYDYNNAPVYLQNGAYYQPNAQQAPPAYDFSFPGISSYSPLPPPTIGSPGMGRGATATGRGYTPPELQALNTIGQIDPQYLQLANELQSGYGSTFGQSSKYLNQSNRFLNQSNNYLRTVNQQYKQLAAGQLPPGVQREIQQQAAAQEAGTGNTAGVSQAVQQGMTTGTEGYNLLQQALANRQGALGTKQNALGERQNALTYNQGVLQQASNYLTGGSTPYGIGSNYVNNALNQQNAALSGGQISYNPYAQGAPAFSYINPGAGGEFAQGTTGFLNAGVGATPGSPDTSGQYVAAGVGATGAIIGGLAASGALAAF